MVLRQPSRRRATPQPVSPVLPQQRTLTHTLVLPDGSPILSSVVAAMMREHHAFTASPMPDETWHLGITAETIPLIEAVAGHPVVEFTPEGTVNPHGDS